MAREASRESRGGLLSRWRKLSPDRPEKIVGVTVGVCLVCALLVSSAAVLLKPRQLANRERERTRQILALVESVPGIAALLETVDASSLEARTVELATGRYLTPRGAGVSDPRADRARVYLVRDGERVELVLLPVQGPGYISTLYGYLAVAGDANTILGLGFYEHAETPGIGAQIDDPDWRALWRDKKIRDEQGRLRIGVAKGRATQGALATYQVDGISGATRTGEGVTRMLHFWLGPDGFGPYLERIRAGEG